MNVVKWGGAGGSYGVLYTASSDRTVRIWDAEKVSLLSLSHFSQCADHSQGRPLHTLKDHAHWVTTLALNTDFVLRTGPFDHTNKKPVSDEEGLLPPYLSLSHLVLIYHSLQLKNLRKHVTTTSSKQLQKFSFQVQMIIPFSSGLHSLHLHLPLPELRQTQQNLLLVSQVINVKFVMSLFHQMVDGLQVRRGIVVLDCGKDELVNSLLHCVDMSVPYIGWRGALIVEC